MEISLGTLDAERDSCASAVAGCGAQPQHRGRGRQVHDGRRHRLGQDKDHEVSLVTADLRGVTRHATTRPNRNGELCRGSWPQGLLAGQPTDEDHPPLLTVRTDHRLDRQYWLRARLGRRNDGHKRRVHAGWRLELQHLLDPGGIVAVSGM